MNLSELVFKTNTKDLDAVITKLAEVGAAVQNLGKVQTKAATDQNKTDQAAAKSQDAQNKAAISGIKLEEARAKSSSETSKVVVESADKQTLYLQKLADKVEFVKQGWTTGQASQLAYAKSLGIVGVALTGVQTSLQTLRSIVGGDPFDKSLGALTAVTNRVKMLDEATVLYNATLGLTKKQTRELAQDKMRLDAILESEIAAGKNLTEVQKKYNATLEDSQRKYIAMARAENDALTVEKQHETAIKSSAQAAAFIDKEMRRAANAADEVNKALGRATNNGLFRFQEELKKTGISLVEQKKKLQEYKDLLATESKGSAGGLQGKDRTDYISRALGPQITDIFVGLATGQKILTVALQQGGQVRDQLAQMKVEAADIPATLRDSASKMMASIKSTAVGMGVLVFGVTKDLTMGAANMAMKFTLLEKSFDFLTQYTLRLDAMSLGTRNLTKYIDLLAVSFRAAFATGILLAIAALILIAVELYNVMKASTELSQALNMTGASMGTNTDSLTALAKGMGDTGKSTSYLMGAFADIAKAGGFTSKEFEAVARSAIDMEKYVGVALKDTIAAFKELKNDPVKALEEFGKSNGLVSISVLETVRSLTLQGKTAEATALAMKEMLSVNATIALKTKADMSPLDLAWIAIKESVSSATSAILRFLEAGFKFKISTEFGNFSTLLDGISGTIDAINKKFIELDAQPVTFDNIKKQLTDLWELAKKVAGIVVSAPGSGNAYAPGTVAPEKQPDSDLKDVNAKDRNYAQAETLALQAKLTAAAQFFGAEALAALTPVQKAQMHYNQMLEKAAELTKLLGRDQGIVGKISLVNTDAVSKNAMAAMEHADRLLKQAQFAEVHNLPSLSDATTARYEQLKAGSEQEIALVQKKEKDKLDLLKTSLDEDRITTLQYISEKQTILKTEGAQEIALLKKEQDEIAAEAGAHVAKVLAIREKLLIANSASNTGKTPSEAASIAEGITKNAQKQIDDFIEKFKTDIGKINSGIDAAGVKIFTDLAQAVAEYGKNLKTLRKEVDDYNVSEAKHFAAVANAQKTDSALLWASPAQAAVIRAQSEEVKRFIPIFEKIQETVRRANREYESLFDSSKGPPNLNPDAVRIALEFVRVSTAAMDKEIADNKANITKAGVDAAIAYEEQQRAELAKKIADVLMTALFDGGKAGAKALRTLIIDELKKPIKVFIQASVNALMQGGGDMLGGLLGGGSGGGSGGSSGGAGGGSGGIVGQVGGGLISSLGAGLGTWLGGLQSAFAPTTVMTAMTTAWATGSAAFASGASLMSSIGTGLVSMGPVGWVALAVVAVMVAMGLSKDELGIKIDNSVRDGNGRKDIINSSLGQFDVSGDMDNKTFAPLIKSVQALDKYIADNLLSEASLAKVKERIQSISSNATDWFGFDDESSAKTAVEKASKLFLQQRYSVAFDEINKVIADQIRNFSGTADELLKFLNDTLGVLAVLKQAEPTLKGIFGQSINIDDILKVQKDGESLTDTFTRIVSVFHVTNDVATLMGKTSTEAFGAVGMASLAAREKLVMYAGGVSALQSALKFYMDNFYSDAERGAFALTSAQNTLNAGFSSLGLAIPKTRDEFRALLSGIDTTTDAGAKLYAALLALAPAMAAVTSVTDTAGIKTALGIAQPRMQTTFGQQVSVKDVQAANKAGETLEDTYNRLTNVFTSTNVLLALMGKTSQQAFGAVGLASTAAREDLIKFAGGVDKLMSALEFYQQNFFTEAERSAMNYATAQATVNDTFREAGIVVPKSKEAFKALMSSIDLTTDAGRKLFATLLAVAPFIATLYAENPVKILAGMAESSIVSLFKTVITTATDAEDARIKGTKAASEMFFDSIMTTLLNQISGVIMSSIIQPMSAGLLSAADIANVSTINTAVVTGQIQQTSAVAAGNTTIAGSVGAGTALVLGGAIAAAAISFAVEKIIATIAVLAAVFASPQFKEAFTMYTAAIGNLSSSLFTATTGIPGYSRPGSTGDRGTGGGGGGRAGTDTRAEREKKLRQEAYDLLVASINKEKELIKTQLDLVKAIYDTTVSAIKTLKAQVETPQGTTYQNARALISRTAIDVRNGVLPDAASYADAVSAAVNGVNSADYATKADEQIAKMQLLNELQSIADVLGPARTGLEQQLAYLEQIAAAARLQLDALNGNTVVMLTLAAAIANWTATTGSVLPGRPATAPISSPFAPVTLGALTPTAIGGGGTGLTGDLASEIRALRAEVTLLRAETRSIVDTSAKSARILDRVSQSGDALRTTAG